MPLVLRRVIDPSGTNLSAQDEHFVRVLIVHTHDQVERRALLEALFDQDAKREDSGLLHFLIAG